MIDDLKSILINFRGFKSRKKLVVIESDDWGSVRMPSKKAYNNLLNAGIKVNNCGYNKFDNLETVDDINALIETLNSIQANNGRHPILTANTIVANPNFERIRENKFEQYEFETFKDSYLRHQGNNKTLELIKEGIKDNLYYPQLHGREHIYLNNWMSDLKANDNEAMLAFDNCVYGLSTTMSKKKRKSYLTALDFNNEEEMSEHEQILKDASEIFEKSFGFKSDSFIPPNYTWHPKHEDIFKGIGIKYIQGGRAQKSPYGSQYKTIKHYMGKKNSEGLIYSIRNSAFEPSTRKNVDWRKKILNDAKFAFLMKTPLIISAHRVNFMGGIVESNRTQNLSLLKSILLDMIKLYPDVEFISSDELGRRMSKR